jgi:hypothetical protein
MTVLRPVTTHQPLLSLRVTVALQSAWFEDIRSGPPAAGASDHRGQ